MGEDDARRPRSSAEGPRSSSAREAAAPASTSCWRRAHDDRAIPDCDVFLDDVTVSRSHAVLRATGVLHRGPGQPERHVREPRRIESGELSDGDEVQIGKYWLTFLVSDGDGPGSVRNRLPHDRRRLPAPGGGVPGHLDLEDPVPRGPGPARAQRTQGGYRLFGEDDVERLRTILRSSETSSCRCG